MGLSSSQPLMAEQKINLIQSDYFTEKPSLAAVSFLDHDKNALILLLPKSKKTRFVQTTKDWLKLLKDMNDSNDWMLIFDFQTDDLESIVVSALHLANGKKIFFFKKDLSPDLKKQFDCVIYPPSIKEKSFTVIHKQGLVEQIQLEEKEKEIEFIR